MTDDIHQPVATEQDQPTGDCKRLDVHIAPSEGGGLVGVSKICIDCERPFNGPGRRCLRCRKRRSRRNRTTRCFCGKQLGNNSLCCAACWTAALDKAREQIMAKSGRVAKPMEIPERYREGAE